MQRRTFVTSFGAAVIPLAPGGSRHWLLRIRIGTETASLIDAMNVRLTDSGTKRDESVCKPRWINWRLPDGVTPSMLTIAAEKPGVKVHAVELYREKAAQ